MLYSNLMNLVQSSVLLPVSADLLHYRGLITVGAEQLECRIDLPHAGGTAQATVTCEPALGRLLRGKAEQLQRALVQSADVNGFFKELDHLVSSSVATAIDQEVAYNPLRLTAVFYSRLLEEIEAIGWDRVQNVHTSLSSLTVSCKDRADRIHELVITVPPDYPANPPSLSGALPTPIDLQWNSSSSRLVDAVAQFEVGLDKFQALWVLLDELDKNSCILDPVNPSRADTHRRIALGGHACAQLTINPLLPAAIPQCVFIGADSVIGPFQQRMAEQAALWDVKKPLHVNLQEILGTQLPPPTAKQVEDCSVECGVCYSYMLDDTPPTQACNNQHCGQVYHLSCIVDWLQALPDCRRSFDTIFGECPYCSNVMSVSCK